MNQVGGDRGRGPGAARRWNLCSGNRRRRSCCCRRCLCCSWLTLRPRTRRGIWLRNAVAAAAAYVLLRFLVPALGRLDFNTRQTWFDLGWYGFMPSRRYRSFAHASPALEFLQRDERCSTQNIVFAPRGPAVLDPGGIILDHAGELVWRHSGFKGDTQDLRVQEYRGEKFLTFWVGEVRDSQKKGAWYMMDNTYTVRHQIRCKNGLSCDMHEFQLTPNGTALLAISDPLQIDLTAIGSSAKGWILDCRFQEIDIETGELLFEWLASDHFAVEETYRTLDGCSSDPNLVFDGCGYYRSSAFDFYHINSLQKDPRGNYLVSARNTHTITYVDGRTGDIIWNLGGRKNAFTDLSGGNATNFSWQHHARWLDDAGTTLSLFDNGGPPSRGMIVSLDTDARTASLRAQYAHPGGMGAPSQGNAQVLDGGNVMVGWGRSAAFSEFAPDGALLCDAHFGASAFYSFGAVTSYRVSRDAWTGRPAGPPSVVIDRGTLFVSWNGATEVRTWRVEGANGAVEEEEEDKREWEALLRVRKEGFETEMRLPATEASYDAVRVVGLDGDGEALGASEPLEWPGEDDDWLGSPLVLVTMMAVAMSLGFAAAAVAYMQWRRKMARRRKGDGGGEGASYSLLREEDDDGMEMSTGDMRLLRRHEAG